ncbi:hypothetical protein ACFE04_015702 [Oxalis oulophora]
MEHGTVVVLDQCPLKISLSGVLLVTSSRHFLIKKHSIVPFPKTVITATPNFRDNYHGGFGYGTLYVANFTPSAILTHQVAKFKIRDSCRQHMNPSLNNNKKAMI